MRIDRIFKLHVVNSNFLIDYVGFAVLAWFNSLCTDWMTIHNSWRNTLFFPYQTLPQTP